MKIKRELLHSLLALMLLFSFTSTLTHTEHLLEEIKECHLCESQKHLRSETTKTTLPPLAPHQNTLQEFQIQINQMVAQPINLEEKIEAKKVDLGGLQRFAFIDLPFEIPQRAPPSPLL